MIHANAYTGPQRFAHRGLVQAAPENTLGAFQGAMDGGYEGIEIDVQMTRDGEIVIAHDSNFTRMTLGHPSGGSNRRIRDLTWDEIQKIELPYPDWWEKMVTRGVLGVKTNYAAAYTNWWNSRH